MADENRPSSPVSPVLIVLVALAGVYNLPKFAGSGKETTPAKAAGPAVAAASPGPANPASGAGDEARDVGELELLEPLGRLIGDGRQAPPVDTVDLFSRVDAAGYNELDALVALVPDPDRTSNGYAFDLYVDAIERAFESWGFILDRYRYPWVAPPPADKTAPPAEAAARSIPRQEQPGVLVFRSTGKKRWVFLVFLVLETPTRGLNHPEQLAHALDLVDRIEARATRPRDGAALDPEAEHVVHILGPSFSGTRESLRLALTAWLKPRSAAVEGVPTVASPSRRRVRITAGAASDIPPALIESPGQLVGRDLLGRPRVVDDVQFRTTRNSRLDVLWAMYQFLGGDSRRIGILAESNTGFGQGLERFYIADEVRLRTSVGPVNPDKPWEDGVPIRATIYDFPLYISQLRKAYEDQGLLGDAVGQLFRSAGRLDSKADEPRDLRDLLPQQSRELTTRHDDLTLVQTLTEIARNHYDAVGLFASNPYDAVFLARMLRRYDPDVLIFTTEADLLLTQAQSIADLRGVLVGSSYPLYPHNRSWSYPHAYSLSKHFFFESSQAVYNATKFVLNDVYQYAPDEVAPLEYGLPFATRRTAEVGQWPPIWIGMVGNRGIYPVHVLDASPHSLRDRSGGRPTLHPEVDGRPANRALKVIHAVTEDATPERRRAWFAPWYHEFWGVLYGGLLVVVHLLPLLLVLDLACRSLRDSGPRPRRDWAARLARRGSLDGVVRRLGWVPDAATGRIRGEGLSYLGVLAAALVLLVFGCVSWPLLAPAPGASSWAESVWTAGAPAGGRLDLWRLLAHEGMVVGVGSLLLAILSPWAARRPAAAAAGSLVAAALLVGSWVAFVYASPGHRPSIDAWLLLERIVSLPNGVSPLFPLLFVGAAWAAWLDAQLRRRELRGNAELPDGGPLLASLEARPLDRSLADPLAVFFGRLGWIRQAMRLSALAPAVVQAPVLYRVLLLAAMVLLGHAVLPTYFEVSPDRPGLVWSPVFWGLFLAGGLLMAHQTFLLAKSWEDVQELLRNAARLPLGRAFDRLPARLGRWVFEPPRAGWRLAILRDQARALKAHCDDEALRDILAKSDLVRADDPDWAVLGRALDDPQAAPEWPETVLFPWLARIWAGQPATYTWRDPAAAEGAELPIAPRVAVALTDDERKRLRAWAEIAENFLALRLLHWIGRAQAHLWVLIRAVVIGVLSLLLAVNSYPFPARGRVGSVLSALAAVAAIAVLRVLIGINRDELISRVTNTLPGRLKFDRDLLSQMFTYVVPLIGLLAALSYDVSDLLRSWFDPFFRGQM